MKINFGQKALKNYLQDLSLVNCIPDKAFKNWIRINPLERKVEIDLD